MLARRAIIAPAYWKMDNWEIAGRRDAVGITLPTWLRTGTSSRRGGIAEACFNRLLASDVSGVINIWDRRASDLPCLELATNSSSPLNSIKLNADDQVIFGASKHGTIYMWDIRGGRSSAAFQNNRVVSNSPIATVKLASELERIATLKDRWEESPSVLSLLGFEPETLGSQPTSFTTRPHLWVLGISLRLHTPYYKQMSHCSLRDAILHLVVYAIVCVETLWSLRFFDV
ncbi:hypothetical protein FXO38_23839 [Capsicum annuum]|nr:hypothetical protein FXO38_23839 [Capsicum annuum]KAF3640067.1 hypothetical protein FXO37_23689 [Capsicum annuum]